MHILERRIYEIGHLPTHFWFSFQVDLTPKSRLNPTRWLVKDLKMPQIAYFHTTRWLHNTSKRCCKTRPWVHFIFKEFISKVMLLLLSWGIIFSHQEYTSTITLGNPSHLLSGLAWDSFTISFKVVRRA